MTINLFYEYYSSLIKKISSTDLLKNFAIFKAKKVDGTNFPFSIEYNFKMKFKRLNHFEPGREEGAHTALESLDSLERKSSIDLYYSKLTLTNFNKKGGYKDG